MMEVAYGHPYLLQRTQTAPMSGGGGGGAARDGGGVGRHFSTHSAKMSNSNNTGQNSLLHSQGHTSSNYSIQSQQSSRSSGATTGTSHSTLFAHPPLPSNAGAVANGNVDLPNGNDVTATANIMNTVADASSSLFQICVSLRLRLTGVPGFSDFISDIEEDANDDTDPVTVLWRTFRQGYPLMILYNTLRPTQPLVVPPNMKEEKRGKAATFKFLQACINDLKFPQEEMFIITDLYADDTTGFVKVAKVVNRVLDVLVHRDLIDDVRPTASDLEQAEKGIKRTQRQHIILELVTTERTYVQHLEKLQAFRKLVEEKGIIPGDAVHDIFLNLNSLLDFQRRFLIRVEQTNLEPEEEQNWGKIFQLYEDAFKVYEPYIANQKQCEKTVVAEFSKLAAGVGAASLEMRQMVESPTSLYGFLMKPFQRLSKYPLLLDDLYKKGDLDEERRHDLVVGKEVTMEVLARTNKAVDKEEKAEAVQELKVRVEDWKGHRVEGFGDLLLYGTFTVLKSENLGSGKDGERQYHVYLFETILLCCKDIDLSKPKNKLSNKQLTDKRGKPKLQLKGRIFMQNVTDLVSLAKPGSYTCQIFWKGDPSIENFIIRFTTEEMMKKWAQHIEMQRRRYRDRTSSERASGGAGGIVGVTSATEFEYMRGMGQMENPYARFAQEDEEDEEDDVETLVATSNQGSGAYPYNSETQYRRIGSSTSLRSRSTTGESSVGMAPMGPAGGRQPQNPRYPGGVAQPNLALRTRELAAQSPGDYPAQESYFSPVDGSPSAMSTSTRTSTSSGMYSFSRLQTQMPQNGYYEEGHGGTRFTAPAIARQRELSGGGGPPASASAVPNGYPQPGPRGGQPPQRPGMGMHSAQQMPGQPRNRSASSPDIHNNPRGLARGAQNGAAPAQGANQPPVPDMPAPYQQNPHMIPRSQSNSPNLGAMVNGMAPPQRGMSPQMQRERAYPPPQQQRMTSAEPTNAAGPNGSPPSRAGPRAITPSARSEAFSPPLPPQSPLLEAPTQLKVRVHCEAASQTLTLVVPINITYQTLKDRIDAKLARSTQLTLSEKGLKENQVKLKYLDEDDFVSIQSDDDVVTAFEAWREQQDPSGAPVAPGAGMMGEIDLYCR